MQHITRVAVHPSLSLDSARANLVNALRAGVVPGKCHYESTRQAQSWLNVHTALSPFQTQSDVAHLYELAAQETAARMSAPAVNVISLGCGGGKKDRLLVQALTERGIKARYAPTDVSLPLVLASSDLMKGMVAPHDCFPLVWDMEEATNWHDVLEALHMPSSPSVVTFFGMLPNFTPGGLGRLCSLIGEQDRLLISANLAPGPDYRKGVEQVLPGYDNQPTREWLTIFLTDLGILPEHGKMHFTVESDEETGWLRVSCVFKFRKACAIHVCGEQLRFEPGEELLVFVSYRHTPGLIKSWAKQCGLHLEREWLSASGEEGVFLLTREAAPSSARSADY